MSKKQDMKDMLPRLIRSGALFGASDCDAVGLEVKTLTVRVRQGEVEFVERSTESGVGFRAFHDTASAVSSSSNLGSSELNRMVKNTCERARVTEAVEHAGLADPVGYAEGELDLELWDPDASAVSVDTCVDEAIRAEAAALAVDERLTNSEGAERSVRVATVTLANSHGLIRQYMSTRHGISAVPVASDGKEMVRDWWMSSARFASDLSAPEAVGRKAGERTIRRMGAVVPETMTAPVVFSPLMAGRVVGAIVGALDGYALVNGASFLKGKKGNRVGSERLNIIDDGTVLRGLGSRPFDGEGLPAQPTTLIGDGVLQSYLLDSYTARKLGEVSTHNASRSLQGAPVVGTTNVVVRPGEFSQSEILESIVSGVFITELFGFGVNATTGDYSQGAAGFRIRNGKLEEAIHEFTIAGNLMEMMGGIEMMGNDPFLESSVRCPTIKIGSMTVAGQ